MPFSPDTEGPNAQAVATGTRGRVVGIVRGREIDAQATLSVDERVLAIAWDSAATWRLDLDALDGVAHRAMHVSLYLHGGDVLEISGDDTLRLFALKLLDAACAMPELTRGLRAFGSQRGAPGPAHDQWFAPLLSARRAVAGVSDPLRQVTLMDGRKIAQQMAKAIAQLAKERAPRLLPMQRAIEAALTQESESVFAALDRVALTGDALQGSAEDTRMLDWRRWVDTLREAFAEADECWSRSATVLAQFPAPAA